MRQLENYDALMAVVFSVMVFILLAVGVTHAADAATLDIVAVSLLPCVALSRAAEVGSLQRKRL